MTPRGWPISHVRSSRSFGASVLILVALLLSSQLAVAQFTQQGPKLIGTGAIGQGASVALSGDGNTAIVSGSAACVFTRGNGVWTQQGNNLATGTSVALSADGNTAIVGAPTGTGGAWVYTRSGGVWTQQGDKLVGTGAAGGNVNQGASVALSADGNTAIVGGPGDNIANMGYNGAAWVFSRSNGVWTQQGRPYVLP
jgi:hypothetical protein